MESRARDSATLFAFVPIPSNLLMSNPTSNNHSKFAHDLIISHVSIVIKLTCQPVISQWCQLRFSPHHLTTPQKSRLCSLNPSKSQSMPTSLFNRQSKAPEFYTASHLKLVEYPKSKLKRLHTATQTPRPMKLPEHRQPASYSNKVPFHAT